MKERIQEAITRIENDPAFQKTGYKIYQIHTDITIPFRTKWWPQGSGLKRSIVSIDTGDGWLVEYFEKKHNKTTTVNNFEFIIDKLWRSK